MKQAQAFRIRAAHREPPVIYRSPQQGGRKGTIIVYGRKGDRNLPPDRDRCWNRRVEHLVLSAQSLQKTSEND